MGNKSICYENENTKLKKKERKVVIHHVVKVKIS